MFVLSKYFRYLDISAGKKICILRKNKQIYFQIFFEEVAINISQRNTSSQSLDER